MTQEYEQLEAQSRVAIKAWCDDPSVHLEFSGKIEESWLPKNHPVGAFDTRYYHYRIAKPKKWYRAGEDEDGNLFLARNKFQEKLRESQMGFKRWLPEGRIYYYD